MRVTLAYPYSGAKPDTTVDLPRAEALRLISDGAARRAPKPAAEPDQAPEPEPKPTPKPTPKPRRSRGNTTKEQR